MLGSDTTESIEKRKPGKGNRGRGNDRPRGQGYLKNCATIVFPISIAFPDSTTVEYADMEALEAGLLAWFTDNLTSIDSTEGLIVEIGGGPTVIAEISELDPSNFPSIVYPIRVDSKRNGTITVNSNEELIALLEDCKPPFGRGPWKKPDCFDLVFPLTVIMEDGTEITATSDEDLSSKIEAFLESNPDLDLDDRPTFVFPIKINYDGEEIDISSQADITNVIRECKNERRGNGNGKGNGRGNGRGRG